MISVPEFFERPTVQIAAPTIGRGFFCASAHELLVVDWELFAARIVQRSEVTFHEMIFLHLGARQ